MALPVRPPSSSQDFPPDLQQSTSPHRDASTASVAQASSEQIQQTLPTTPSNNSTNMCGPIVDSSPLSSPISPLHSPPGAWPSNNTPKMTETFGPTTPKDTASNDCKNDVSNSKQSAVPSSASSTKSNMSKKRARAEDDDEPTPAPPKKAAKKAPKQPKASAAPTRSSGRNRKAPERFTEIDELPKKNAPAPPRKGISKVFDPVYITTNSTSRLGKADVYHMLLTDSPWTCLTVEQKQQLFSMLPKTAVNTKLLANIVAGTAAETARPREFNQNFNLFRTDVAKFIEDLQNGHLGKSWQAAAEQAVIERAEGKFDEWKAAEAEAWWGQK